MTDKQQTAMQRIMKKIDEYLPDRAMTPKEKAEELVDKFMNIETTKMSDYSKIYLPTAKQCALIAVDELISDNEHNENIVNGGLNKRYWQEVKQEIEKL